MGGVPKRYCPECKGKVEEDTIISGEFICQDCGLVTKGSLKPIQKSAPEPEPSNSPLRELAKDENEWKAGLDVAASEPEPQDFDSEAVPLVISQAEDPDWFDSDVFVPILDPREKDRTRRCLQAGCSGFLFDARILEPPPEEEIGEVDDVPKFGEVDDVPNFVCQECFTAYDIDKARKLQTLSASKGSQKPIMKSVILIQKARAYLNSYDGSKGPERSTDFTPFFEVAEDLKPTSRKERMKGIKVGVEDDPDEVIRVSEELKNELQDKHLARLEQKAGHESILPGPICLLETNTLLPPRGYWLRNSIQADGTYKKPRDYIPPKDRLDFELYIWLHQILKNPWPLEKWFTHIRSGKAIRTILKKGGALSKRGSECLARLNQRSITMDDVINFYNTLQDFSVLSLEEPTREKVVSEAFGILKEMHNLHPPELRTNVLDLFIENACLASHKGEPVEFWRLDRNKKRQPVGHLKLISIPIAYAVAYSVASLGHSVGHLLAYAHIDVKNGLTNCEKVTDLDYYWACSLKKIGHDGELLRK